MQSMVDRHQPVNNKSDTMHPVVAGVGTVIVGAVVVAIFLAITAWPIVVLP